MDSKRSNAINIGLTVLPPPRTIKTAILNFDEYTLNKEGIEVRGGEADDGEKGRKNGVRDLKVTPMRCCPLLSPLRKS